MKKSDVLAHFKTGVAVAEVLKINPSAVYQWPEVIPEKQALRLEKITDGALSFDASYYPLKESTA